MKRRDFLKGTVLLMSNILIPFEIKSPAVPTKIKTPIYIEWKAKTSNEFVNDIKEFMNELKLT
ncbi:MAG: hypothetical protein KAS30_01725 [Candidatus Diapherotrites archaeon]|nr:hypothetical protein [Candidatus Diapherotrites archaeon]